MSVLLLSGGLDSLVLLARECTVWRCPLCVSFSYGQKHTRELEAAAAITAHYRVPHHIHRIPDELLAGSALTGQGAIPRGLDYRDPAQAITVVPNRNMVFLSLAAAEAVRGKHGSILIASHAGDAAVYPDCRPEFIAAASLALKLACGVSVQAPFLGYTKREIVLLGQALNAPLHLAWSCYEGGTEPCRECGACRERREVGA